MVSGWVMAGNGPGMVCAVRLKVLNTITSAVTVALAVVIAWESDPAPLEFVFETVIVAAFAAAASETITAAVMQRTVLRTVLDPDRPRTPVRVILCSLCVMVPRKPWQREGPPGPSPCGNDASEARAPSRGS